ncbi:hypothetical protein HYX13_03830 [Candidatus Woesearchaeota archaeon]|nr:hypothetical protein [Candidatus Woesearchaeota archaeon]
MTEEKDYQQKYFEAREALQQWVDQQGHDRCWYYPDIFNRLVKILGVKASKNPELPPRKEFERGCQRYQEEEYGNHEE